MSDEEITNIVNSYSITTLKQIKQIPESHLNRIIAGNLRSCIKAHGAVTLEHIGSAAKRITNQLLSIL